MATLCRIALQSTLLISRVFVSWAPTLCLCTRALSFLLVVEDDFLPSCGLSDFFPARPSWQSFSCVCHFFHQHFFYRHIHITVAIACVRSRRQQEFSERVFPLARYRWRGNRVSAVPCISTSERFFPPDIEISWWTNWLTDFSVVQHFQVALLYRNSSCTTSLGFTTSGFSWEDKQTMLRLMTKSDGIQPGLQ